MPNLAHMTLPHATADVKCRFFWRVGSRPSSTDYPELNAEPVIPKVCVVHASNTNDALHPRNPAHA